MGKWASVLKYGKGLVSRPTVACAGVGYLAWQKVVNDKPVVRSVGDVLVGEQAMDKTVKAVDKTTDVVGNTVDAAGKALKGVADVASGAGESLGGLFSGLTGGNVSGMSVLGLLLSGLLVFGRFGWLGKIAGVIMGMMMLGGGSQSLALTESQEEKSSLHR